jgi:hypothetical protein
VLLLYAMVRRRFVSEHVGNLMDGLLKFLGRTIILQLALCFVSYDEDVEFRLD